MSFNLKALAVTAGLSATAVTAAFSQTKSELKLNANLLPRSGVSVEIFPEEIPGKIMIGYTDEKGIIGVCSKTLELHAIDGLNKAADGKITLDEIVYYKYADQNNDTNTMIILEGTRISKQYFSDDTEVNSDQPQNRGKKLKEIPQVQGFLPKL